MNTSMEPNHLQWYANHVEHPDPDNLFIVKPGAQSVVQRSLDRQANLYAQRWAVERHDAHAGLPTDVLSARDHRRVLQHVFIS